MKFSVGDLIVDWNKYQGKIYRRYDPNINIGITYVTTDKIGTILGVTKRYCAGPKDAYIILFGDKLVMIDTDYVDDIFQRPCSS